MLLLQICIFNVCARAQLGVQMRRHVKRAVRHESYSVMKLWRTLGDIRLDCGSDEDWQTPAQFWDQTDRGMNLTSLRRLVSRYSYGEIVT